VGSTGRAVVGSAATAGTAVSVGRVSGTDVGCGIADGAPPTAVSSVCVAMGTAACDTGAGSS